MIVMKDKDLVANMISFPRFRGMFLRRERNLSELADR
jgi:hypothetical protein